MATRKKVVEADSKLAEQLENLASDSSTAEIVPSKGKEGKESPSILQVPVGQLISYGQKEMVDYSNGLKQLLSEISRQDAPVVFDLFEQLEAGAVNLDPQKLEEQITARLRRNPMQKLMIAMKLGSSAEEWKKANNHVNGLLRQKSQAFSSLLNPIQSQIELQARSMLAEIERQGRIAAIHRQNVQSLGEKVKDGEAILAKAKVELEALEKAAKSGNAVDIDIARMARTAYDAFESRVALLKRRHVAALIALENVALTQSASYETLMHTVNTGHEELIAISEALLTVFSTSKTEVAASVIEARRNLRAKLQVFSSQKQRQLSERTAKLQADGRVQAVALLADATQAIVATNTSLRQIRQENQRKIAASEKLLRAVEDEMSKLDHAMLPDKDSDSMGKIVEE